MTASIIKRKTAEPSEISKKLIALAKTTRVPSTPDEITDETYVM